MRVKERREVLRAQAVEALVLLVTVCWSTWLLTAQDDDAQSLLLRTLASPLLVAWNVLALAVIAVSWRQPLPSALAACSRQERDAGLVVGCVLPPLVFLSRLQAQVHFKEENVDTSLLYAWLSISVGFGVIIKLWLFQSTALVPSLVVDALVLPVVFQLGGLESDDRFVLASVGRITVSAVFAYGMKGLPRSFTVGEGLLVAQGVSFAIIDVVLASIQRLSEMELVGLPDSALHAWHLSAAALTRDDHVLALLVGVLGSFLVCAALSPILRAYGAASPTIVAPRLPLKPTATFAIIAGAVIVLVVYPWSCVLLSTWNPFAWLVDFLLERAVRLQLIAAWVVCLVVLVPLFAVISERWALRNIIARKLFHLLVVVMFVPAYFLDVPLLVLSYGVALAVFCLVECVRAVSLPPVGHVIASFMKAFIDHREAGRVILTHTYLLLGCALPLWLAAPQATNALAANAGVIALGVGDAMGAVVGSSIGKRKLFGNKTVEGTAAILLSMVLASLVFEDYHVRFFDGAYVEVLIFLASIVLTGALEAATAQIDNLVLPLFFFVVCNLTTCHGPVN